MNPTQTDAIQRFLNHSTHKDLADLYDFSMEAQVNVAQDGGELITGTHKGKDWKGWTDGIQTWKSFRIPMKASSDPEYDVTKEMTFDLVEHAEGIGMTGWDWYHRVSKWVAFDFDNCINHTIGLTHAELEEIRKSVIDIDFVTARKSTSGLGLHIYVFLNDVPTENHNEHAALARSILGMLSALSGADLQSKVDTVGGNMWVWHTKMLDTDGLTLLKQGNVLSDPPKNWRDHIAVTSNTRKRNIPSTILVKDLSDFERMVSERPTIDLDDEHKRLIAFLEEENALWWWDSDHHMLVTHTKWLEMAHEELSFIGLFSTVSAGTNQNEQNCFCFPLRSGAWTVRRYSKGIQESPSWDQDSQGWTRTYLNREPSFDSACRTRGGVERKDGSFFFSDASASLAVLTMLNQPIDLPAKYLGRESSLKMTKNNKILITLKRETSDTAEGMDDWYVEKGRTGFWDRIVTANQLNKDSGEITGSLYDEVVRNTISESGEDCGWVLNIDNEWINQPMQNVRAVLGSMGIPAKDITVILGSNISKSWKIVNRPFQDEYPGNREWNRRAAQLAFTPKADDDDLVYKTWMTVLNHCGERITPDIENNEWCREAGIRTGGEYLKYWIASVFQYPEEPLPYLFFHGPQDSGKSIFHESIDLLLTKGYKKCNNALDTQQEFNGELDSAIVCVVEEIDLSSNKKAANRLKEWVTARKLVIRQLYKESYQVVNTTHWIQCANSASYCTVFPGDTRITVLNVAELKEHQKVPKPKLIAQLLKEGQDFITAVMKLEIPESDSRLRIPPIASGEKMMMGQMNENSVETFFRSEIEACPGNMLLFSDVYTKFLASLDRDESGEWGKKRFSKSLPEDIMKGRSSENAQICLANVKFAGDIVQPSKTLTLAPNGYLK